MEKKINIDVECPMCNADLLLHENATEEDILQFNYNEVFECIFCGWQFIDPKLKLILRNLKINKICTNI